MPAPVPDENVPLLDELSRLFNLAEAVLRKMKSPRGVWLNWSDSDAKRSIGFDKDDGIWRLLVGTWDGNKDVIIPLARCPVAVKVDAVKRLPDIRDAILRAKQEFVPEVEEAITELKRFLTSVVDPASTASPRK